MIFDSWPTTHLFVKTLWSILYGKFTSIFLFLVNFRLYIIVWTFDWKTVRGNKKKSEITNTSEILRVNLSLIIHFFITYGTGFYKCLFHNKSDEKSVEFLQKAVIIITSTSAHWPTRGYLRAIFMPQTVYLHINQVVKFMG